jgi:aryl-phospho-beta-D-glucosidase BglC (GH1 family)
MWAEFWGYVANKFKNNKNVLGYELINEPFGNDIYNTPISELWPGY